MIHGFSVCAILENTSGSNVAAPMMTTAPKPSAIGQITVAMEIEGAFISEAMSGFFGPGSEGGIMSESIDNSWDQLCFRPRIEFNRIDRRYLNHGVKVAEKLT